MASSCCSSNVTLTPVLDEIIALGGEKKISKFNRVRTAIREMESKSDKDAWKDAIDCFKETKDRIMFDPTSFVINPITFEKRNLLEKRNLREKRNLPETLEALNINCFNCITDVDMKPLSELTNLKELQISCSKITDHGVTFMKGLHKLALLNMERCPITSTCLDSLSGLHKAMIFLISSLLLGDCVDIMVIMVECGNMILPLSVESIRVHALCLPGDVRNDICLGFYDGHVHG
uniref:Uncharacterized protein n=1 Tax=Tanacetum cinerariifolium TaxID=118510 RepID=A0A6L2MGH3_TANCI|nr:hypothetical protein [Tanacetum cinerariifolium]